MPRGAPALATLLEKNLLVHEPNVGRVPKIGGDVGNWRILEHRSVCGQRVWIGEILVENRGGIFAREIPGAGTRMREAPVVGILGHPHRVAIERAADEDYPVIAELFAQTVGDQFAHHFLPTRYGRPVLLLKRIGDYGTSDSRYPTRLARSYRRGKRRLGRLRQIAPRHHPRLRGWPRRDRKRGRRPR